MSWKLVYTKQAQKDAKSLLYQGSSKRPKRYYRLSNRIHTKLRHLTKNWLVIFRGHTRGESTSSTESFTRS